jgi:hypothetical protein
MLAESLVVEHESSRARIPSRGPALPPPAVEPTLSAAEADQNT